MENKNPQAIKARYDQILRDVQTDIINANLQLQQRKALMEEIEQMTGHRLVTYISKLDFMIDYDDINLIASLLNSVGNCDKLDLIVHSGGGIGVVAEKIVSMCRQFCTGEFRVIIPNLAKSAATMLALGADKIVMGITSELGPIDAQVPIMQSGMRHFVSAQTFIDAKNNLETSIAESVKKGEPIQAFVTQLSSLNPAFIEHCRKSMDFANQYSIDVLGKFMLKESPEDAKNIAKNLCSTSTYFVHGKTIDYQTILGSPDLKKLKIEYLSKEDKLWDKIFELYLRSEVFLDMLEQPNVRRGKLVESSQFSMNRSFPMSIG